MDIGENKPRILIIFIILIVVSFSHNSIYAESFVANHYHRKKKDIAVLNLRCEFKSTPLGVDVPHPLLSWEEKTLAAFTYGQYQTSYRIQVASSLKLLKMGKPDLWDSHKVISSKNNNIPYDGKELHSGMNYYWRVKVWDKNNVSYGWSKPAFWKMGLLQKRDWQGKWIMDSTCYPTEDSLMYGNLPAPLFRHDFPVSAKISHATLYISGLGYYIAYINEKRVGNHVLDSGWTDYAKRILYSVYDVTGLLKKGANCIGVALGNGWYNPLPLHIWGRLNLRKELTVGQPRFILQLNITLSNGKTISIVSGKDWKVTNGPVIRNNIYLGDVIDDRKKISGWNLPGFNDHSWKNVIIAKQHLGALQFQAQPPIVVADTLIPSKIVKLKDGKYIVDFGQNFAGIIRLKANGKSGTTIKVRYGELLYPDGSLNVMTSVAGQIKHPGMGGPGAPDTAYASDIFILNGEGEETFQPPFTFHGFRYAEISGYPGVLKPSDIKGLVMHADMVAAGSFECSDTLINQIQQACRNTFLSNLFSVQSDCPHREQFGYGGDMLATCEAYMNNFNMSTFYVKAVRDYAGAALPNGALTETAPFVGIADEGLGGKSGPIEWGSVLPVLLYRLYEYYGNIHLIRQHYETVKKWISFISLHADHYIIPKTLGDWESIDPKDIPLSGTAFYYYDTHLLAYFAKLLGKSDDYNKYTSLAANIKHAFIQKFLQAGMGKAGIHSKADQSYSLYFHPISAKERDSAIYVLLNDIKSHDGHISTGMFGTKFIMEVLSNAGYGNVAYEIAHQKTFPGWGYMIEHGATTIWEHWAYSDNIYSHNHPIFGSVSQWFYRHVAGIQPDSDAVGYNKIVIRPDILLSMKWAKAKYYSINGLIESRWEKIGGKFKLDIHIPVNTTARVYLPANSSSVIQVNGKKAGSNSHILFLKKEENHQVFRVGSGYYHFVSSPFVK